MACMICSWDRLRFRAASQCPVRVSERFFASRVAGIHRSTFRFLVGYLSFLACHLFASCYYSCCLAAIEVTIALPLVGLLFYTRTSSLNGKTKPAPASFPATRKRAVLLSLNHTDIAWSQQFWSNPGDTTNGHAVRQRPVSEDNLRDGVIYRIPAISATRKRLSQRERRFQATIMR